MRKYRICMLCDRLSLGGVETHVVTLANCLAREGHEVTVISGGGALAASLLGVRHVTLPLFQKSRFLFLLRFLRRFFKRERFDVIHAHTRFAAFLCRPIVGRRLVTTAHWVFDTRFPKGTLTTWGEQTLAVSPDIAAYLSRAYGVKEERVTLTVNGIDTERHRPEKIADGCIRIVTCSRFDRDRADAAFCLLDVLPQLPQDGIAVTLVGDGDRFAELKEKAEKLKAAFPALSLTLTGGVTDVSPYVNEADIFIGVSRAALEGMATGCATVLAGNEGYLSVFSPKDATLAEESNFCCRGTAALTAEGLLRDLSHLLSYSKEALHRMGRDNRRYVLEHYAEQRMASDALGVYERICKRTCVLCGYYGFHNVGDELLLRALTEQLRQVGYQRIRLLSVKKFDPRALLALKKGADLLLGGGNLLQDATSRRSLHFYLWCAARARGRVLVSGGIGPLSLAGERAVAPLLSRADAVLCRTEGDVRIARRLGAKRARLTADAALTLSFPKRKKGERILLAFKTPSEQEIPALLSFALSLCRRFGKERCFLFVMHPDDRAFSLRLSRLCGIPLSAGDADAFLAALTDCRAVFSSRLHAGIAALGVGVPFSLWKGEEKCRFFIEDLKCLPSKGAFCSLFDFGDRPSVLLSSEGMEEALAELRKRIEKALCR